jgi:hypothetical protein
MIRKHEVRTIAHIEATLNVNTVGNQLVDLGEERIRVEHYSIADRAAHAGMENSTRDLVEDERLVGDVYGMAGIRAALIPDNPVGALGENVDKLAFAFVTPLCADDDDGAGLGIEHSVLENGNAPAVAGALTESTVRED